MNWSAIDTTGDKKVTHSKKINKAVVLKTAFRIQTFLVTMS